MLLARTETELSGGGDKTVHTRAETNVDVRPPITCEGLLLVLGADSCLAVAVLAAAGEEGGSVVMVVFYL